MDTSDRHAALTENQLQEILEQDIWRVRELYARGDMVSIECMHSNSYKARAELERRGLEIPSHLSLEYPEVEVPDFDELHLTDEERAALPEAQEGMDNSDLESLFDRIQFFLEQRDGPFFDFFANFGSSLLHTTTEANWASIWQDREIRPSDGVLQGAYRYCPGPEPSQRNLGHNLAAVSLWDFANPTAREWLLYGHHWLSEFHSVTGGSGILLELERSKLPQEVYIPQTTGERHIGRCLPGIEVFHRAAIPVSAILRVCKFWSDQDAVRLGRFDD